MKGRFLPPSLGATEFTQILTDPEEVGGMVPVPSPASHLSLFDSGMPQAADEKLEKVMCALPPSWNTSTISGSLRSLRLPDNE